MKMLAIFSALLAVGICYPVVKTLTLYQLTEALELNKEPAMKPYYEDAVNRIMLALHTGENLDLYMGVPRSPSGGDTWTLDEIRNALKNDNLDEDFRDMLMMAADNREQEIAPNSPELSLIAVDISTWTFKDLNEALKSPSTKPELIPYVKEARRQMERRQKKGTPQETIVMITPIGLIPHEGGFGFVPNGFQRFIERESEKGL